MSGHGAPARAEPSGEEEFPTEDRWAWRLQAYPLAVIGTIAAVVLLAALSTGNSSAPAENLGGDYPAFYGAGQIAAEGDWDNLYGLDRQIEAQAGLYPSSEGAVARFFAYPPQVAAAYGPLSALDYHWSYVVHTLLMALLLWAAVLLIRPMIPWLRGKVAAGIAIALVFWPMFRGVTGGSNTALTVFLIAAMWRLVHDDRQVAAGFVLGVLLFKPQLAVPIIGLFLLGRYWRVVIGAAVGTAAFYAAGATLQGWRWGVDWFEVAVDFGRLDADVNGHSSISFIGFAENLFGVAASPPVVLAWLLAGVTAGFLGWLWWRGEHADLDILLAITMPGILLLSPHTMSQDGAIVVLSAAIVVTAWDLRNWLPWVLAIWVLGATQLWIRQLGFSPGLPMLLVVLAAAWLLLRESEEDRLKRSGTLSTRRSRRFLPWSRDRGMSPSE